MRDARAEAIRAYVNEASRIREEAREALRAGYTAWYYELIGLATIAEKAAKAEMINRDPVKR